MFFLLRTKTLVVYFSERCLLEENMTFDLNFIVSCSFRFAFQTANILFFAVQTLFTDFLEYWLFAKILTFNLPFNVSCLFSFIFYITHVLHFCGKSTVQEFFDEWLSAENMIFKLSLLCLAVFVLLQQPKSFVSFFCGNYTFFWDFLSIC